MAKITFSDELMAGNIPTFEIDKSELISEYVTKVDELIETRNGEVIVAFQTWQDDDYKLQVQDILISTDDITVESYFTAYIENIQNDAIDFNFFCFDTWEDAFKYCIDLKEGL